MTQIWQTAGILNIHPGPFSYWELMTMREGCERERWERLSFSEANASTRVGVKHVRMDDYNKFSMGRKSLTADTLKDSCKHLFDKEK